MITIFIVWYSLAWATYGLNWWANARDGSIELIPMVCFSLTPIAFPLIGILVILIHHPIKAGDQYVWRKPATTLSKGGSE